MKLLPGIILLVTTLVAANVHATAAAPKREQRITITVTRNGFEPAQARLKAHRPVVLVVTRKVERTCVNDIVIKEYGIRRPLPLNRAVEVRFTPRKPGAIRYACAMDMVAGSLTVE